MEEYNALLTELEHTPEGFSHAAEKARERLNRRRRREKVFLLPCASLAACFLIFVVLVNTSASFAYACSGLPLLGRLAQAVSFSPSLKAALQNDYIQELNLSQSKPGITMNIDYLIVDRKQVNIFYTLYSSKYDNIDMEPTILNADGSQLNGFSILIPGGGKNGEIRHITVDFTDQDVPSALRLDCTLTYEGPASSDSPVSSDSRAGIRELPDSYNPESGLKTGEVIGEFSFLLEFDPQFTASGEVLAPQVPVSLDGSSFTLEEVGIYPTHMNLHFSESADNTAWLTSLDYYIENEKGERFEKISNGITATGSPDSSSMLNQRLESVFFSSSEKLTLVITGAEMLDKDMENLTINLDDGTVHGPLPQNVEFIGAEPYGHDYEVSFLCLHKKGTPMFSPFTLPDEVSNSWSATSDASPSKDVQDKAEMEGYEAFITKYYIAGDSGPVIELVPVYTSILELEDHVVIPLK